MQNYKSFNNFYFFDILNVVRKYRQNNFLRMPKSKTHFESVFKGLPFISIGYFLRKAFICSVIYEDGKKYYSIYCSYNLYILFFYSAAKPNLDDAKSIGLMACFSKSKRQVEYRAKKDHALRNIVHLFKIYCRLF